MLARVKGSITRGRERAESITSSTKSSNFSEKTSRNPSDAYLAKTSSEELFTLFSDMTEKLTDHRNRQARPAASACIFNDHLDTTFY